MLPLDQTTPFTISTQNYQSNTLPQTLPIHSQLTQNYLQINKKTITFKKNGNYPGTLDQCEIKFYLNDIPQILKQNINSQQESLYLVKMIASCHNQQLNILDQQIISVRSIQRQQHFTQIRYRIKVKQRGSIRVVIRMPNIKATKIIQGTLCIKLQETIPIYLPIKSKCQVPKIVCLKALYDVNEKINVIKLTAKKPGKINPIAFRNCQHYSIIFQNQLLSNQDNIQQAYKLIVQNSVKSPPNGVFSITIQLIKNLFYNGIMPLSDRIRRVLTLKIKNSSLIYSFPIQVNILTNNDDNYDNYEIQ